MAPSREIEKLQRRWQENPLGLTFAPLAEAYRKEGMFADALDLLGIGLAQHPNYVPAHIVKGRCFLDAQSDPDAELAFLKVAELDPENVIALKGLADIAERAGRYGESIARLERLLDFDRSNEDARAQLERLKVQQRIPSATPTAVSAVSVQLDPPVAEAAAAEPVSTDPEPPPAPVSVDAPVEDEPAAPFELPRAEIIEATVVDLEVVTYSPVELTATNSGEYQKPSDADTLDSTQARGGLDSEELSAPSPEAPEPIAASAEPPLEPTSAPSIETEPMVADAQLADPGPAEESVLPPPALESVDSFVADLAGLPADAPEIVVEERLVVEEEVVTDAQMAEPELVVTETMAEVFLRQGHRELALAVYSQLATRDPGNQRIREAIGKLDAELRPNQASIIPVYAAVLTGGQSVRAYFETLLAQRRPGAPEGDGLSLGQVFGDEGAAGGTAGPTKADPSFDEFYADSQDALPAVPVTPPPVEAAPQGDDLEGFTDWLKGLRR